MPYRKCEWLSHDLVFSRMKMPFSQLKRFQNKWERQWETDEEAALDGEYISPLFLTVDRVVASRKVSRRKLLTECVALAPPSRLLCVGMAVGARAVLFCFFVCVLHVLVVVPGRMARGRCLLVCSLCHSSPATLLTSLSPCMRTPLPPTPRHVGFGGVNDDPRSWLYTHKHTSRHGHGHAATEAEDSEDSEVELKLEGEDTTVTL